MKTRFKIILWQMIGFFLSVTPLCAGVIVNRERYIGSVAQTVKLSFGLAAVIVFFAVKALGKLRMPGSVCFFSIVFIMSYLLSQILADLTLLSGLALLGEALDAIIATPAVNRLRRKETSDSIAGSVIKELKEASFSGRV